MNSRSRRSTVHFAAIVTLLFAWLGSGCSVRREGKQVAAVLSTADTLKFMYSLMDSTVIAFVPSPAQRKLLAAMPLVPVEGQRPCVHFERALFITPSGPYEVSLCRHCFSVISRDGGRRRVEKFDLPPSFGTFFTQYRDSVKYSQPWEPGSFGI